MSDPSYIYGDEETTVPDGDFDEHNLSAIIAQEIGSSLNYDDSELSDERSRALEYYEGKMDDTPARRGGSKYTSRDVSEVVSWILPQVMRVFTSSRSMVEYEPVAPADPNDPIAVRKCEDHAKQAEDYVNHVFWRENKGYEIVYDATYDAFLTGDGPLKHWWDDTPETEISHHSNLTIEQVTELVSDEGVEILAQEEHEEETFLGEHPDTGEPVMARLWDIKIERTMSNGRMRIVSIEPENLITDNQALDLETNWRFVAHREINKTRSDLVEMGFDREKIDELAAENNFVFNTEEGFSRRRDSTLLTQSDIRSMQVVEFYECYLKLDIDNDGIAEIIQVFYAGDGGNGVVLEWSLWEDDLPFSRIPCFPRPHRFDNESLSNRTMDIQQIKTVVIRQALENLYASNMPMQEVEEDSVTNPDILVNKKFGGTIWKTPGSALIQTHQIPFVADHALQASKYFDQITHRRTGVGEPTMALDPEALANQSATSAQNQKDASYSQVELIARHQAEIGWSRVFEKLLRITIKHQDRPKVIRLRGKFVEMDPRHWSTSMKATVSTGLGTGSKDRDMSMLHGVLGNQVELMDRFSKGGYPEEAVKMSPKVVDTMVKIADSGGLSNADIYFPDIDPPMVQAMLDRIKQKQGQPPPEAELKMMELKNEQEIEKIRGQNAVQIKQIEAQLKGQIEEYKAKGNKIKEAAQFEADARTSEMERKNAVALEAVKAEMAQEMAKMKMDHEASMQINKMKFDLVMEALRNKGGPGESPNTPEMEELISNTLEEVNGELSEPPT